MTAPSTKKPNFSGDHSGAVEASWYSDISYKERLELHDKPPPPTLNLVGAGLPGSWNDKPAKGFDAKGFHRHDDSAMRLMETVDGNGRRVLVVSFSGSDDIRDFVQDANNAAGIKRRELGEGRVADAIESADHFIRKSWVATKLSAMVGAATLASAVADTPEAVRQATDISMFSDESKLAAAAKAVVGQAKAGGLGFFAAVASPHIGVAGTAYLDNQGSKFGGPSHAYASLAEGRKTAIDTVLANAHSYDRIVVAGHSLGGNLATQFSNELSLAVKQAKPTITARRTLAKVELQTINSLWLSGKEPSDIGSVTHFRRSNDLTDIVGPISGLARPSEAHTVKIELDSARPSFASTFDALKIGERHGNSAVLAQVSADGSLIPKRDDKWALESLKKIVASANPIGSAHAMEDDNPFAKAERALALEKTNQERERMGLTRFDPMTGKPLPPKNPYVSENATSNGELRMLQKGQMLERLSNFKNLRQNAEMAERTCLSDEALAKIGQKRTM